MKRLRQILTLVFSVITVMASAQQVNLQKTLDLFLDSSVKANNIPAISVVLIEDGKVIYRKTMGYANLEYKIPNTGQTAFQLASCTKLISATALMTLVQENKLDLQAKVRSYLPDLPAPWDDMRVMDLVAHQSGVADLLALKMNFKSVDEAYDTAVARKLDFAPGTKTVYAGGDYALVQKLVERITGLRFQEFLKQKLLLPLGMNHTVFNNMEQDYIYRTYDTIPYAATVYKNIKDENRQRIFSMMFPSWTYPAGGIFSSLDDLTKWVIAMDKGKLIRPELLDLMWTPAKRRDGTDSPFGVGWIVDKMNGEKVTGHSGGPALADIARLPGRKITSIVLTNQLELRPYLANQILRIYMRGK
ncbi:MAG TPA: serine hydrolase domain-containing protein [Chitinophagaceae bacterium]|nr:serine hydrolase domain-containing protein [Chitinophagaceae bacterium]